MNEILHLSFEVFHDVKELIINTRKFLELKLDLVQIAQSIPDVERSIVVGVEGGRPQSLRLWVKQATGWGRYASVVQSRIG